MISEKQVRRYCYEPEKIENYDKAVADNDNQWDCHHRLEITMNCGHRELKAVGAYYDRPAHDLIFLRREEHLRLHKIGNNYKLGKHISDESRRRISEGGLGNKNHLGHHHSENAKLKMRLAKLGKSQTEEHKMKRAEAMKRYWEKRRNG